MSQHDTAALEQRIANAVIKSIPHAVKTALKDAMDNIVDTAVFDNDEFTKALTDFFNDALHGNTCSLSFRDGKPSIIAGFADPLDNCTFRFDVSLYYETDDIRDGLLGQLAGIDAFISDLQKARAEIVAALVEDQT